MSSNPRRSKKILAIGATTTAAVLIGGGVAVAYWTTTGSGSGTATAGNVAALTVAQDGPAVTGLFPGGPSSTRGLTVTNPGASDVLVSAFTATPASVAPVVSAPGDPACVAGTDFTAAAASITPTTVPAGGSVTFPAAVTIAMAETGVNQDACKGVTLTVDYTVS